MFFRQLTNIFKGLSYFLHLVAHLQQAFSCEKLFSKISGHNLCFQPTCEKTFGKGVFCFKELVIFWDLIPGFFLPFSVLGMPWAYTNSLHLSSSKVSIDLKNSRMKDYASKTPTVSVVFPLRVLRLHTSFGERSLPTDDSILVQTTQTMPRDFRFSCHADNISHPYIICIQTFVCFYEEQTLILFCQGLGYYASPSFDWSFSLSA